MAMWSDKARNGYIGMIPRLILAILHSLPQNHTISMFLPTSSITGYLLWACPLHTLTFLS